MAGLPPRAHALNPYTTCHSFLSPAFASLSLLFLTKKGENGSQIAIEEEDGKSPLIRQVDGPPLVCITYPWILSHRSQMPCFLFHFVSRFVSPFLSVSSLP